VLLPLLGLALNGTSSVLYGSIPELVPPEKRTRAFSIFYTGGSVAGAIGPLAGGALGDIFGLNTMVIALAVAAAITIPLAMPLRRHVR
jgi:predicted MFS family arabinose efflux permease